MGGNKSSGLIASDGKCFFLITPKQLDSSPVQSRVSTCLSIITGMCMRALFSTYFTSYLTHCGDRTDNVRSQILQSVCICLSPRVKSTKICPDK